MTVWNPGHCLEEGCPDDPKGTLFEWAKNLYVLSHWDLEVA